VTYLPMDQTKQGVSGRGEGGTHVVEGGLLICQC